MHTSDRIGARARVRIRHERAYDFDERSGLWLYRQVDDDEEVPNILVDTGRVQLHTFCYGTAARANGFNYIGLTDDATPPAAGDTALTGELTLNGLGRAQGTVVLPAGASAITTISKVFTYTGVPTQGVQKTALFDSAALGVMNHEIQFTQRIMANTDTLSVSFIITLG